MLLSPNSNNGFDRDAPPFMCCFGSIHSRMATIILAVLELLVCAVTLCYLVILLTLKAVLLAVATTTFDQLI